MKSVLSKDVENLKNLSHYKVIIKTFELFDNSDYSDIEISVEEKDEFVTTFEIDGTMYFFQARDENKILPEGIRHGWHLGFGVDGLPSPFKYLKTGKGKQFQVMSKIMASMKMFIEKYNPDKLSFISEGDTKSEIYSRAINKLGDFEMTKEKSPLSSYSGETPWLIKYTKR